MHGYGIIVWPGGDVFEGEFNEDKKMDLEFFIINKKYIWGFGIIINLKVK